VVRAKKGPENRCQGLGKRIIRNGRRSLEASNRSTGAPLLSCCSLSLRRHRFIELRDFVDGDADSDVDFAFDSPCDRCVNRSEKVDRVGRFGSRVGEHAFLAAVDCELYGVPSLIL
jgi:hypothetical protein